MTKKDRLCKRDLFQNPNIPYCKYDPPITSLNFSQFINDYNEFDMMRQETIKVPLRRNITDINNVVSPITQGVQVTPKTQGVQIPKKSIPYNPQRQKASIQALDDETIEKANLIKASRIYYEDDVNTAQAFLTQKKIPYTIDTELSNSAGIVITNNNTGEIKVAYRGTKWDSVNDIKANVNILSNTESTDTQFITAKQQIDSVQEKYNILPDELVGFSRGGSLAITQGNDFGIKTTTFNPLLNGNMVSKGDQGLHSIIRTTEDPVSIGTALGTFKDVKSIYPKSDTLNPVEAHTLEQFVDNNVPRRQPINSLSIDEIKPLLDAHNNSLASVVERRNVNRSFAETFSAPQITSGLVAGVVANKLVKELDPENKLGDQGQEVVTGGIAGGLASGFSSGLAGTALTTGIFAPAVVGGSLGYLAGSETQKAVSSAITQAGGNQATSEITSSTVGGAVGGLGTALGAGLTSSALGVEAGLALAPETLGLSVLAGAVIGGVVGASEYVYEKRDEVVSDIKEIGQDIKNVATEVWDWLGG
jgi:hypothetical protein